MKVRLAKLETGLMLHHRVIGCELPLPKRTLQLATLHAFAQKEE